MSWLSNASIYERRRIVLVFVVTMVIIPLAWWTQRSPKAEHPTNNAGSNEVSQNLTPGFLTGSKETVPLSTVAINVASAEDALVRTGLASYKNFAVRPVKIPGSTTTSTIVPSTTTDSAVPNTTTGTAVPNTTTDSAVPNTIGFPIDHNM